MVPAIEPSNGEEQIAYTHDAARNNAETGVGRLDWVVSQVRLKRSRGVVRLKNGNGRIKGFLPFR